MRLDVPESLGTEPYSVLSHQAPGLAAAVFTLGKAPYDHSKLSLREFEAARIRTAEINGCLICRGFRAARDLKDLLGTSADAAEPALLSRGPVPDEAFYTEIVDWRNATNYTDRERIAIELAERMGLEPGPLAYDESFWSRAKAVFADAELADLTMSIGAWIAGGRVLHVLGLDTVCATPTNVGLAA